MKTFFLYAWLLIVGIVSLYAMSTLIVPFMKFGIYYASFIHSILGG